jgi:hypothetical protein
LASHLDATEFSFFTTLMLATAALFTERQFRENKEAQEGTVAAEKTAEQKTDRLEEEANRTIDRAKQKNNAEEEDPLRNESRKIYTDISSRLREIGRLDPDGRHRRVYERLKGNPKGLAQALAERGKLENFLSDEVIKALVSWDGFARGRASNKLVPEEVRNLLRRTLTQLQSIDNRR